VEGERIINGGWRKPMRLRLEGDCLGRVSDCLSRGTPGLFTHKNGEILFSDGFQFLVMIQRFIENHRLV
jgi:hypothetical protein